MQIPYFPPTNICSLCLFYSLFFRLSTLFSKNILMLASYGFKKTSVWSQRIMHLSFLHRSCPLLLILYLQYNTHNTINGTFMRRADIFWYQAPIIINDCRAAARAYKFPRRKEYRPARTDVLNNMPPRPYIFSFGTSCNRRTRHELSDIKNGHIKLSVTQATKDHSEAPEWFSAICSLSHGLLHFGFVYDILSKVRDRLGIRCTFCNMISLSAKRDLTHSACPTKGFPAKSGDVMRQ